MRRLASPWFQPFAGEDIRSLLDAQARLRADHPYLVWRPFEGPRRTWTYREFRDRVARVAAGLHARGIVAGDVIVEIGQEAVSTAEDVTKRIARLKSEDRRNALLMIADKTGALRFVTVRID